MGGYSASTLKWDEQTPLLKNSDQANAVDGEQESVEDALDREDGHSSPPNELDPASIKRLVRKIDCRIIPILFFTFVFNFIDKIVLSSASVYGLMDDIDLAGNRYPWFASIFYVGYLIWEYPTTIMIQKLPVGKYVSLSILAWGIIVGATSACNSFAQLLCARFVTGMIEAAVSPAFLYIISTWYSRDEIPSRMGAWYAGFSTGGAVANLFSWAIGHVGNTLSPWRLMYIILGSSTVIWAVIMLLVLPDSISTASFLTDQEKTYAESRIATASTGITSSSKSDWNAKEALECLQDPKTWFFFSIAFLNQLPSGGFQAFNNRIIQGFGFSVFESSLTSIPVSLDSLIIILGTGWFATKYKDTTTILISGLLVPPTIAFVLLNRFEGRVLNLFLWYSISFTHGILPLVSSLVASNIRSVTQKMTITALMLIAFCSGNMIGPQIFGLAEAPHYRTAFDLVSVSYGFACLSSLGLRVYLNSINQRWTKEERLVASLAQGLEDESHSEAGEAGVESIHAGFRYWL